MTTEQMICGDCGWSGTTPEWRAGCKGFPCELAAATHDYQRTVNAYWDARYAASGTEAGTGETEGLDPQGDGPTGDSRDAQ